MRSQQKTIKIEKKWINRGENRRELAFSCETNRRKIDKNKKNNKTDELNDLLENLPRPFVKSPI